MTEERKIIQITTYTVSRSKNMRHDNELEYTANIVALCNDGTVWYWDGITWYDIDPIPQHKFSE